MTQIGHASSYKILEDSALNRNQATSHKVSTKAKFFRACLVASLAAPIFYWMFSLPKPEETFLFNRASAIRSMADTIHQTPASWNLQELNGVKISEIELRARPGAYATSGFLSNEESLLEVMKNDWQTVNTLGLTHREIAAHLQKIWDIVSAQPDQPFLYDVAQVSDNTIHSNIFKQPLLRGKILHTCGYQNDIFHQNDERADSNFDNDLFAKYLFRTKNFWGSDLHLTNLDTGDSVIIAYGVIDYIRQYGFYEGNTSYRADPTLIAGILSGHKYCDISKAINQTCIKCENAEQSLPSLKGLRKFLETTAYRLNAVITKGLPSFNLPSW